jgi:hypothetical protein
VLKLELSAAQHSTSQLQHQAVQERCLPQVEATVQGLRTQSCTSQCHHHRQYTVNCNAHRIYTHCRTATQHVYTALCYQPFHYYKLTCHPCCWQPVQRRPGPAQRGQHRQQQLLAAAAGRLLQAVAQLTELPGLEALQQQQQLS